MSSFQKTVGIGLIFLAGWLMYVLTPILMPFLLGGLLAYLGNPLVNYLMRWHLPRSLTVSAVFVVIFGIVLVLLILLIPVLENQIIILTSKVPEFVHWAQAQASTIPGFKMPDVQEVGNVLNKIIKTITHSSVAVFAVLINIVLTPVVTFYLLRDWPVLIKKTRDLIPRKHLPVLTEIFTESNVVLGAFFRGQLWVMLALGIIYTVGFWIIGLNLSLLLGVLIALLSIVPYVGAIIGLMAAVVAAWFQFQLLTPVIFVIVLFVLGHILESMVLTPLLIGDRIGLHPVAVIFAILTGGQLFGFFGVLLALPIAALLMVWVRYWHNHYLNSRFYR